MVGCPVHGLLACASRGSPAAERAVRHPHAQASGGGAVRTLYRVQNIVVLEVEKNIEATPGQLRDQRQAGGCASSTPGRPALGEGVRAPRMPAPPPPWRNRPQQSGANRSFSTPAPVLIMFQRLQPGHYCHGDLPLKPAFAAGSSSCSEDLRFLCRSPRPRPEFCREHWCTRTSSTASVLVATSSS